MKVHVCGSPFYRAGDNETAAGGQRFRCKRCRIAFTVRDGQPVTPVEYRVVAELTGRQVGRPETRDWRHE